MSIQRTLIVACTVMFSISANAEPSDAMKKFKLAQTPWTFCISSSNSHQCLVSNSGCTNGWSGGGIAWNTKAQACQAAQQEAQTSLGSCRGGVLGC